MNSDKNVQGSSFEEFRREKRRRKLQHEAINRGEPTGRSDALSQIQYHEQMEIIERKIQREMHEFFTEARKLALGALQEVTEEQAVALTQQVYEEMTEFIRQSLKRAETLVKGVRAQRAGDPDGAGVADLEARIRNLTGEALDRFRSEGTANLENKHLGEDPFDVPAKAQKAGGAKDGNAPEEPAVTEAIRVLMEKGILDGETAERIQVRKVGKKPG